MTLPALSAEDEERLDLHSTSVRDIEQGMMGLAAACTTDGLDLQAIQAMNNGSAFRPSDGTIEE